MARFSVYFLKVRAVLLLLLKVSKVKYKAKMVCEITELEVLLGLLYIIFNLLLFNFIFFKEATFGV